MCWQALYEYNTDVVLADHDHDYEWFAPQYPLAILFAIAWVLWGSSAAFAATTYSTEEFGGTAQPEEKEPAVQAFDPNAPPKATTPVTPVLKFGGRISLESKFEHNFDLADNQEDDLFTLQPILSLSGSFDPNEHLQGFMSADFSKEFAPEEEGRRGNRPTTLVISQAFLLFKQLMGGLSLQIGRQRFVSPRGWLYDQQLDALRALYRWTHLGLEFSTSRKGLVDGDLIHRESSEHITNYALTGTYDPSQKMTLVMYALIRSDQSSERQRPVFYGMQATGRLMDDVTYWLDAAYVGGRDGSKKIKGFGLDAGFTYTFDLPLRPGIAFGYAFGTGDSDTTDRVDNSFRQSGLQYNSDKLTGVTWFKYYGELFDPELSNLSILTSGVGIRPTRKSSLECVYHYYLQDEASNTIRDSDLDAKPTGLSKRLGSEIDLIVGYREIRDVNLALKLGYFMPGAAFADGADNSFLANFKIQFNF